MTVCVWLTNAAVIVVRDVSVHLKVRRAVKDLAERFRVLRQPIDVRLNVEIQLQSQSICQKRLETISNGRLLVSLRRSGSRSPAAALRSQVSTES